MVPGSSAGIPLSEEQLQRSCVPKTAKDGPVSIPLHPWLPPPLFSQLPLPYRVSGVQWSFLLVVVDAAMSVSKLLLLILPVTSAPWRGRIKSSLTQSCLQLEVLSVGLGWSLAVICSNWASHLTHQLRHQLGFHPSVALNKVRYASERWGFLMKTQACACVCVRVCACVRVYGVI